MHVLAICWLFGVTYGLAKLLAIAAVLLAVALVGGFLFAVGASIRVTRLKRKQQTATTEQERQRATDAIANVQRKAALPFSILLGADGRLSTSKTVAFAWTVVVAYVLLALVIGWPDNWDDALKNLSPSYLLLLGGPYAALVLSKGIVNGKVVGGSVQKPDGDNIPRLSDLVADDSGQTDLFDAQYVLFNLIAMAYVIDAFVRASISSGFPSIPTGLALLTGGPAAVYVANKALSSNPPSISSIVPSAVHPGETLQIFGQNFAPDLFPGISATPTGMDGSLAATAGTIGARAVTAPVASRAGDSDPLPAGPVGVMVGGTAAQVLKWTDSLIDAQVPAPATAPTGPLDVAVTTSAGQPVVQASALTMLAPTLIALDTGAARATETVTLTGNWGLSGPFVLLNGVKVTAEPDPDAPSQRLKMTVPKLPGPFPVTGQVWVVDGAQSSQHLPLQVLN